MHLNVGVITVLAGILVLQKHSYGNTKDQTVHNAGLVITALAAYNPHHPEQSLHITLLHQTSAY